MGVDFFEMMKNQQKEASKQEAPKEVQKPQKQENEAEEQKAPVKNDKKESPKKEMKTNASSAGGTYEYPFSLYTEGHTVDISEYGFEEGQSYTPKQICDIMLQHRHYEFAGEMTFKMFDDDNMLVATAKQYKKG